MLFQWGLVCDRRHLVQLITTLYLAGAMLGGLALGMLSDRYGFDSRLRLLLQSQLLPIDTPADDQRLVEAQPLPLASCEMDRN